MLYFILGLIVLTAIFWILHKSKLVSFCPICAATVLVWLISLAALYLGAAWADPLLVAILMGASLGALAEKHGGKLGFLWKTLFVTLGLPSIYFMIEKDLAKGLGLLLILLLMTLLWRKRKSGPVAAEKKDIFKDCCE